jgi:Kef-type K+ transport system membrane component KefB
MKKNIRSLAFYILFIGGFLILMYYVIQQGESLELGKIQSPKSPSEQSSWDQFQHTYAHNLMHPLAMLLLQIITIIITARVFAFLCRKIGQPSVVGEIVAGIFLGPSFIGFYFPEFAHFLFPSQSLGNLQFLSQIGLILFMFIVGMELDLKVIRNRAHEAVVVSHVSIIFPFALGVSLAYFIYNDFAPANIPFYSFALFMGIAMSITAFPVLARIVQERNLTKTRLGAIVITCAAADDITAWCILAAVIAIVNAGSFVSAFYTILIAIGYVFVMLKIVRPFLRKLGEVYYNREGLSKPIVAVFFLTLLLSSYATEVIGIHALFGAFLAGVIMPSNLNFRTVFVEKVEDVSLVLLLPLFFVFTGLRTQINLIDDPAMWKVCGAVVVVAVTGKFFGSAFAAKVVGQSWRDSLSIGALMNTRGLMELVVLNIGYDLGILTPEVFAMMVIMALATTCMTGPALDLINKFFPKPVDPESNGMDRAGKFRILISFGDPQRATKMLMLAHSLIRKVTTNASVTALHLSPSHELNQFSMEEYERESFAPINGEARKLNLTLVTLFKPSTDIERDIIQTANVGNFDLMLMGFGQSVFEGSLLGKVLGLTTKIIDPQRIYGSIRGKERFFENIFDERTRRIMRLTKIPVGIFIDKGLQHVNDVIIFIFDKQDAFLLQFIQRFILNSDARVIIYDMNDITKNTPDIKESIRMIEQTAPQHVALFVNNDIEGILSNKEDLLLISLESWTKAMENQKTWLTKIPSTLIVKG